MFIARSLHFITRLLYVYYYTDAVTNKRVQVSLNIVNVSNVDSMWK